LRNIWLRSSCWDEMWEFSKVIQMKLLLGTRLSASSDAIPIPDRKGCARRMELFEDRMEEKLSWPVIFAFCIKISREEDHKLAFYCFGSQGYTCFLSHSRKRQSRIISNQVLGDYTFPEPYERPNVQIQERENEINGGKRAFTK
jgi:hypothetical protein